MGAAQTARSSRPRREQGCSGLQPHKKGKNFQCVKDYSAHSIRENTVAIAVSIASGSLAATTQVSLNLRRIENVERHHPYGRIDIP